MYELHNNLNELRDLCFTVAKSHGWEWSEDQKKDPNFLSAQLMLIVSEASEALEDIRTRKTETVINAKGKPEGFPTEIADIIIRCLHLCGELNIDIEKEVKQKVKYNNTREYRHGNKTL